MNLTALLSRPCVILRRLPSSQADEFGNEVPTETVTETVCELQQTQRTEPTTEGELSATTWLLVLPAGTPFTTADAVLIDGQAYESVGEPWQARNPRTGAESHVEATVRRTAAEGVGS